MESLKGMWLLLDRGDSYIVGHVVDVSGDYLKVSMKTKSDYPTAFYTVYHISELTCECRECVTSYFFDNEAKLKAWIDWIDRPEDNIVKMVVPTDKKKH